MSVCMATSLMWSPKTLSVPWVCECLRFLFCFRSISSWESLLSNSIASEIMEVYRCFPSGSIAISIKLNWNFVWWLKPGVSEDFCTSCCPKWALVVLLYLEWDISSLLGLAAENGFLSPFFLSVKKSFSICSLVRRVIFGDTAKTFYSGKTGLSGS